MAISDLPEDIIKTHILTRLDGQTLAVAGSASSRLQPLCSDQKLWSDICSSNWPSTGNPLVSQAISNFPSGHRSFFSDSFSSPSHRLTTAATSLPPTSHVISSVDVRYHGELIFSKAERTNTTPSDWFQTSPFRIELLGPKELVPSAVKVTGDDPLLISNLESNLKLSWIMIDPTQNRSVNLSSLKPVSVHRNWLTNGIDVTFAVVISGDDKDYENCCIQIISGVKEVDEELILSGLSLTILDMEGKCLSGKESMVILQGVTAGGRRRRRWSGGAAAEEEKERYFEYTGRRRERKEMKERRESRVDMAFLASGVALLMTICSYALLLN